MGNNTQYDIAIAGGGLAGLSLSILCAREGLKTVVLEKDSYPRHKVCGEYISMESWPHLERLGVNLQALHLPKINKLELTDTRGRAYLFPLNNGGFGISRYLLDDQLYQEAIRAGAEVQVTTRVTDISHNGSVFTVKTNQGSIDATIVVNAYGKRSNLDIKWNRQFVLKKAGALDNWVGIKYHVQHDVLNDTIALHNFSNGYCGISAIEEGRACLCYLTRASNLRKHNGDIRLMEKEVLCTNPVLQKIFTNASFLYDSPLVISQVSFASRRQVENNMMMIGDAAGLITPLCGNGMSMALHASVLAFSQIREFHSGKISYHQMLSQYSSAWRREFSSRLKAGRLVQLFFGNPAVTNLFLSVMDEMPSVAQRIIASTHGKEF